MNRFTKPLGFKLILFLTTFLLTACGSGGGVESDPPLIETGAITGTVSGTKIVAVNGNGDIVASDDTSGKTANDNGNFNFSLSGIPVGAQITVYLLTDGGIYPLYFDSNGNGIPDNNVFSLSASTEIVLGFVDTDVLGQEGRAVPQNNPTSSSDVASGTENTGIPTSLYVPDTGGLSLSDLVTNGLDAIQNGLILQARANFQAAVDLAGISSSNDADTARFFYALTRVGALGFDLFSDGNPNDMNRAGDILDRLGCEIADTRRSNFDAIDCPEILPNGSPTVADAQEFLYTILGQELEGAVANLDSVSESFNLSWKEPFDGETVESDFGDVLFFRGSAKTVLAAISIQKSYNLDADIDQVVNNSSSTIQLFLANNGEFLELSSTSKLAEAKGFIAGALEDMGSAIVWMESEEADQTDDWITLDSDPNEINKQKDAIATIMACLDNPCTIDDNETVIDTSDDAFMDLGPFFSGRNLGILLPDFAGDDPSGLFPDASFSGTFTGNTNLNEDINPSDGIPDILQ